MATVKVALLPLEQRTSFTKNGREIELREPDGRASEAQVMMLFRRGHLAVVKDPITPPTKGELSYALDAVASAKDA